MTFSMLVLVAIDSFFFLGKEGCSEYNQVQIRVLYSIHKWRLPVQLAWFVLFCDITHHYKVHTLSHVSVAAK